MGSIVLSLSVPIQWGPPSVDKELATQWLASVGIGANPRFISAMEAVRDGRPCPHPGAVDDDEGGYECIICGAKALPFDTTEIDDSDGT